MLGLGFETKALRTRRRDFLSQMEQVVPWQRLCALIEPHYPKSSPKGGRPPHRLETMLRIHFLQQWYSYSDPAMEEALHEIPLLQAFTGLDAGIDAIPDESSVPHFRYLLERHQLAVLLFGEVEALLRHRGLMMRQGSIVDATLIAASPSTRTSIGSEGRDGEPASWTSHKRKAGQELTPREEGENKVLASVRAKVEHAFRILKCQFGYRKVRYEGLAKNEAQVITLFMLGNLYQARRSLIGAAG